MNMHDEGYIKFKCHWTKSGPLDPEIIRELNIWRDKLYAAQLLGAYPDGIGYGNVSQRLDEERFVISGSATGNIAILDEWHYSLVDKVAVAENTVWCSGPIRASSESMSHAAVYRVCPEVQAVFHIHNLALWEQYLHQLPTTAESAAYGSPEMVWEIERILAIPENRETGVFVMAGHREGIFGFGDELSRAGHRLLAL